MLDSERLLPVFILRRRFRQFEVIKKKKKQWWNVFTDVVSSRGILSEAKGGNEDVSDTFRSRPLQFPGAMVKVVSSCINFAGYPSRCRRQAGMAKLTQYSLSTDKEMATVSSKIPFSRREAYTHVQFKTST